MFGLVVTAFVAGLALLQCKVNLSLGGVNAGFVGLSLRATLPIVSNLSALMSSFTETEKELISVERVQEYILEPPEEGLVNSSGTGEECQSSCSNSSGGGGISGSFEDLTSEWPFAGNIQIHDLCVR